MVITKSVVVGAVVALVGQGVAAAVTVAVAIAAGGGPDAHLDAGEKLGVLMGSAITYGIAQIVVLGACIAVRWRLGPPSTRGLVPGWLAGLAVSIFYLCGGFGG